MKQTQSQPATTLQMPQTMSLRGPNPAAPASTEPISSQSLSHSPTCNLPILRPDPIGTSEGEQPASPPKPHGEGRVTSNQQPATSNLNSPAFTLIELLIVMGVIATLAALLFPVGKAVGKKWKIAKAQAELHQVETWIERYKAHYGFYPPDNPGNPVTNQLYFELTGTILTNMVNGPTYVTLDGNSKILVKWVPILYEVYGAAGTVNGFANSSRTNRATDEIQPAVNFITDLKPAQIGQVQLQAGVAPVNAFLVCSVPWPYRYPGNEMLLSKPGTYPHATDSGLNPWRYVSTNPTNNPHTYDLWVDLVIGGVTNRISNWNPQPEVK